MLILRAKIALNAVICMILFIFSLIVESWPLRNVGFYRSLLQFYIMKQDKEKKKQPKETKYKTNFESIKCNKESTYINL